jgi:biopolymer transport protein ExbD
MYGKRQLLPNVIVSMRVDKNVDMGMVTDIQQELRKAYCLRINYSASVKI